MSVQTSSQMAQDLTRLFKSCLDILRTDREHLVGDEALYELSRFLILKSIEPKINDGSIDIYCYEHYSVGMNMYREKFNEYLEYVKFSRFVEYAKNRENENKLISLYNQFLWKLVLSQHPKFLHIFENGKNTSIKEDGTVKKLLLKLDEVDFTRYDIDILGEAYEAIFVDTIFGAGGKHKSELGQFFTPTKVKQMMVKMVNPVIKENREIESVMDPSCGTGGILNTVIKHYYQMCKDGLISEERLKQELMEKIYGIEIKGKIYNLCTSNMLVHTGEVLPNVECEDSIRTFHNISVDTIIANPPFSVKIEYEELKKIGIENLHNYIPIGVKGKSSEMYFLQMMIHCLKLNGRCATVMLDGEKMYSNTKAYHLVREYLVRSCELHEVIYCPGGTFTSTSSKTCILFFTKRQNRADVLELKTKTTRGKVSYVHKFKGEISTRTVKFMNYNLETNDRTFIKEVPIEKLIEKNYSFNVKHYKEREQVREIDSRFQMMKLSEVCEFKNGKNITKDKLIDGEYPVIGGGISPMGYHNTYNRNENTILCSSSGANAGYISRYKEKIWASDCFSVKSKDENILLDNYLFYFLKNNQNNIFKMQNGAGQPHVYSSNLSELLIPVPSIERQNEIVQFLESMFEDNNKLSLFVNYCRNKDLFKYLLYGDYNMFQTIYHWYDSSNDFEKQIEFFEQRKKQVFHLYVNDKTPVKELSEICEFHNGENITKDKLVEGEYPVIGGGVSPMGYHNSYNIEKNTIVISKDGANAGYVSKYNTKSFITNHGIYVSNVFENMNQLYLFYFMKIKLEKTLYELQKGAGVPGINKSNIEELSIPVPPLRIQQKIVDFCEDMDRRIEVCKSDIEQNKMMLEHILSEFDTETESIIENEQSQSETNSEIDNHEDNQIFYGAGAGCAHSSYISPTVSIENEEQEQQQQIQDRIQEENKKKTRRVIRRKNENEQEDNQNEITVPTKKTRKVIRRKKEEDEQQVESESL